MPKLKRYIDVLKVLSGIRHECLGEVQKVHATITKVGLRRYLTVHLARVSALHISIVTHGNSFVQCTTSIGDFPFVLGFHLEILFKSLSHMIVFCTQGIQGENIRSVISSIRP